MGVLGSIEAALRLALGRARRRMRLPRTGPQRGPATAYLLAHDFDQPAGGIRVMYRHVDVLNRAGFRAAIMHQRPGFRCSWFPNDTVVTDARARTVGPEDLLVVSELDVDLLAAADPAPRHVVFNQNPFNTWRQEPRRTEAYYAGGPRPQAIVTVSEHSRDYLRAALPGFRVERIRLAIDPALFHPPAARPANVIAYMPRKGAARDVAALMRLLSGKAPLAAWTFRPIEDLAWTEVADALRACRVFVSVARDEGFGLPAAEAMACGNLVIGHHGFGGREFFLPEHSIPVEEGDTLGLAQAILDAVRREAREPGWMDATGLAASRFVLGRYAPEYETADVLALYGSLLPR